MENHYLQDLFLLLFLLALLPWRQRRHLHRQEYRAAGHADGQGCRALGQRLRVSAHPVELEERTLPQRARQLLRPGRRLHDRASLGECLRRGAVPSLSGHLRDGQSSVEEVPMLDSLVDMLVDAAGSDVTDTAVVGIPVVPMLWLVSVPVEVSVPATVVEMISVVLADDSSVDVLPVEVDIASVTVVVDCCPVDVVEISSVVL